MSAPRSTDYGSVNGRPLGNGTQHSQPPLSGAAAASGGGMTNDEKAAVGGLVARDENKGAAVHVRVCLVIAS